MDEELRYVCPKCSAGLSREGAIMLTMTLDRGDKTNLILDPKPGVYGYTCNPPLSLNKGEWVNCFCPYCWESLQSPDYPNFVHLQLKGGEDGDKTVLFSRLVGEHKTYVINKAFVEEFGDGSKALLETA